MHNAGELPAPEYSSDTSVGAYPGVDAWRTQQHGMAAREETLGATAEAERRIRHIGCLDAGGLCVGR